MLVGLASAKGAPGVTTAAVALSAVSAGLMVELDPSGGSVDCWLAATGEPSLIPAASALRRQADPASVAGFATEVVPGLRVLRAPTSGILAESTIAALGDRLLGTLAKLDEVVIVDGGRWSRGQPTASRLANCDAVGLVCSPTIEGVEAARWQLAQLTKLFDPVVLILAGERPYGPGEVAEAVGSEPVAVLAWDRRGLARLLEKGVGGGWRRSALARSARSVLDVLGVPAAVDVDATLDEPAETMGVPVSIPEPGAAHA